MFDLFFLIRNKTGWLGDCLRAGFSKQQIDTLDHLADQFADYDPAREVKEWEKEVVSQGGWDVYAAESDNEKISLLSKKIAEIYEAYNKHSLEDRPFADRHIALAVSSVTRWEKLRRSLVGRKLHTTQPQGKDRISDWDIERARAYPLEKLVPDLTKFGYTFCRWHDDKRPSFLVKNGFGYCFSCGAWCDSLKWMMEVEKHDFQSAVRALNQG